MIFFSFLGWGEKTFNIVVCEKERKRRIFCGWKFFGRERKLGKEKKYEKSKEPNEEKKGFTNNLFSSKFFSLWNPYLVLFSFSFICSYWRLLVGWVWILEATCCSLDFRVVYRFVIIVSSSLFDIYKSYFHFGFKTTLALSLVLNSLIKHKMGLRSIDCLFICSL